MKTNFSNLSETYSKSIYNESMRNYPFSENAAERIKYIRSMNFDAIHILPIIKTVNGSSYAPDYSLYSIDYDPRCFECSLSKESIDKEEAERYIKMYIDECHRNGIEVIYDLVPGHAGIGARIIKEAPEFFDYDENGNIIHQSCPGQYYEDLARFCYEKKPKGLFEFIYGITEHFVKLGVDHFRCDMSVHLDMDMWEYVISNIKKNYPDVMFIGESFGTTADRIIALKNAGFDMYYNSSFWWKLNEDWLPEQNKYFADAGLKSVGIIANHDTERWLPSCGSVEVAEMKMKLMLWLNSSVSITCGDEYGISKKYNVFTASPYNPDDDPPVHDFTGLIRNTLAVKLARPALCAERFKVDSLTDSLYIIRKEACGDICEILVNNSPKEITAFYNSCYITATPFSVTLVR